MASSSQHLFRDTHDILFSNFEIWITRNYKASQAVKCLYIWHDDRTYTFYFRADTHQTVQSIVFEYKLEDDDTDPSGANDRVHLRVKRVEDMGEDKMNQIVDDIMRNGHSMTPIQHTNHSSISRIQRVLDRLSCYFDTMSQ